MGPMVAPFGSSASTPKPRMSLVENHQPEWIVNFGGPPLSKTVLSWLQASPATDYFVVDPFVRWPDPVLRVTHLLRSNPVSVCLGLKT